MFKNLSLLVAAVLAMFACTKSAENKFADQQNVLTQEKMEGDTVYLLVVYNRLTTTKEGDELLPGSGFCKVYSNWTLTELNMLVQKNLRSYLKNKCNVTIIGMQTVIVNVERITKEQYEKESTWKFY